MKAETKAHLAILSANVIYGINYTLTKGIMPDYVQPYALTFMRVIGASLLFWAFSFFTPNEKIEAKDKKRLFLSLLIGIVINQTLFIKGISLSTPINASIIVTVSPILVILASAVFLKIPITSNKLFGVLLGCCGAVLLVLHRGDASFGNQTLLGNLLLFTNAGMYAVYLVIVKPLMSKYSVITLMKWSFLAGIFLLSPLCFEQFMAINWATIPWYIWLSIAFLVVMATFMGYLLNVYSLKALSPTVVGFYIYLQPIVSTVFAISLGKDTLSWTKIVSMLMVFAGVYLISKPSKSAIVVKSEK